MFNKDWENEFLFTPNTFGEPLCMICFKNVKRCHKFNIQRHYRSLHQEYFEIKDEERKNLVAFLKAQFEKRLVTIEESKSCAKASAIISAMLASQGRPYVDGVFFKELATKVLECFGKAGRKMSKIFDNIHLFGEIKIQAAESAATNLEQSENIKSPQKEPDLGDDLSPLDFLVQNEPITALSVEGEVRIKEEPGDWNPADYDMVNVGSNDTGEIKPSDNETKCSSMEEDDHWYYLRSLLPFFRQLDDMQTLRVRTKFQQILMSELSTNDPNALTMFNVSSSNLGQHT